MTWKGWGFNDPQYPLSSETWNGGEGRVTFNYLQQREEEPVQDDEPPLDTDPWDITDGGYRGEPPS